MEFFLQGHNILLLAAALASAIALIWPFLRPSGATAVSPSEATMLINREDAVVLDVREAAEFTAGHLPEARNVPAAKIQERMAELHKFKERPIIVCCASGGRSAAACAPLRAAGFSRLYNLSGGIEAWRAASLPLKKGAR